MAEAQILSNPHLIEHARTKLPNEGILQQDEYGRVYLELAPQFTEELASFITYKPCDQWSRPYPSLSQVTIIGHLEKPRKSGIEKKSRTKIGTKIPFEILEFCELKWGGIVRWCVEIKSTQLENIRKECGFSAIPKNQHDLYYAREEGFFIPISLQQHEGFAICTMPDRRAFVVRSWLPE